MTAADGQCNAKFRDRIFGSSISYHLIFGQTTRLVDCASRGHALILIACVPRVFHLFSLPVVATPKSESVQPRRQILGIEDVTYMGLQLTWPTLNQSGS